MNMMKYHKAADAALRWCLEKQNEDGSIRMEEDCFDGIYKFPAAMVVMGKNVEAARMLNWLERTTLQPNGDLSFAGRKVILDWHNAFYLYTNSWIAIGAQRAGFFRLADRTIEYILQYQNPTTGDFQSGPRGVDASGLHDTTITSNCAIACLYAGRVKEALKAADGICNILRQNDLRAPEFYFRTDPKGRLVKDYPEERKLWFRIDARQPGQLYWYLGISSALLCQAYEVSRSQKYLEAAEAIFEFLLGCNKDLLASFASGKVGYAGALLYRTTGKNKYRESAKTLMDWLVSVQKSDGRWTADDPDYAWFLTYDCTAEFAYWTEEMVRLL